MCVSTLKGIHVNEPCMSSQTSPNCFHSSVSLHDSSVLTEMIMMVGIALVMSLQTCLSRLKQARLYTLLISP